MSCRCEGPCRVPDWAKDGSWYSNNPARFALAVAKAHLWFSERWRAGVRRARAEIAAMTSSTTYPCVGCDRYAFSEPGVLCFWCRRGRQAVTP